MTATTAVEPEVIDQETTLPAALPGFGPDGGAYLEERPEPLPKSKHPVYVYLASLRGADGIRTMRTCLENIASIASAGRMDAETFPWERISYPIASAIRSRLQSHVSERTGKPLSVASVNKHLAALRGTVSAAWDLGYISAEDKERINKRALKTVRGSTGKLAGRALSAGEISALIRACVEDQSPAGVRDAAIIGASYVGLLRRAEVVRLDVEDVVLQEDGTVGLWVFGKGNKVRGVYLDNGAADALRDWIKLRGDDPGALFVPVNKSGSITIRRMTSQAVYMMEKKRGEQAKVAPFGPHDLRRSGISDLLDNGVDLPTVQGIAGHESPTTTSRYDRRGERAKRAASSKLHVPYVSQLTV